MEPVILIIAITGIISGTFIRYQKLALEKEKLKYLSPANTMNSTEVALLRQEVDSLKNQLSNIELIVTDSQYAQLPATQTSAMLDTIEKLNRRIMELEKKKES